MTNTVISPVIIVREKGLQSVNHDHPSYKQKRRANTIITIDQSLQSFSSVLRLNNFHANCTAIFVLCICSFSKSGGRNNAKYAFQYTFKNKTTQYAKKKKPKRKNNVWTFTTIFEVGHPSSPSPNWVSRGLLRDTYSTGCPKSSFLYFVSLYFSTTGLGKQII